MTELKIEERFLLVMTKMDRCRNAGWTVWRQSEGGEIEMVWTLRRRYAGYIGRRMLKMELPVKKKQMKAKEEVFGYGEGRHAGDWHNSGRYRGQEEMGMIRCGDH